MDELDLETLKKIEEFFKSGSSNQEIAERLGLSLTQVTGALRDIGLAAEGAGAKLGNFLGIGSEAGERLTVAYAKVKDQISKYAKAAQDSNGNINSGIIKSATILQTLVAPQITSGTEAFDTFGKIGSAASMKVSDSLGDAFNSLPKGVQEMVRLQESAQGARAGLYSMLQQSGSMYQVMRDMGQNTSEGALSMENLDNATAGMSKRLEEIGEKAQLAPKQVNELVAAYGEMPGMLNAVADASDRSGDKLDAMVKTVALARGLGMDFKDVVSRQKDAMLNWGSSIEKANDNLIYMNQVAQELGVTRDSMTKFLDDATSGTNRLKDSTQSAVIIMETLGKALKDAGMGERGVGEMLSGTVQRMRNLDVGTAGFINQQAGGKGGLGGFFEMEALKQKGDEGTAEMLSRAAKALEKTIGGPIATLEDFQAGRVSEGELYRQTQLAKTFGVADDETGALKFLEAAQKGGFDDLAAKLKDPIEIQTDTQKEQNELVSRGNEISSGMLTTLLLIANKQDALSRTNAITLQDAGEDLDKAMGFEDRVGTEGLIGSITGIGSSIGINSRTGEGNEILDVQNKDTLASDTIKRGYDFAVGGVETIGEHIKNTLFNSPDGLNLGIGNIKSSEDMRDTAIKQAGTYIAPAGTPPPQQMSLDGNATFEIVLTDEERNIIVSREFVKRLDELARKKGQESGPNPFSGAGR